MPRYRHSKHIQTVFVGLLLTFLVSCQNPEHPNTSGISGAGGGGNTGDGGGGTGINRKMYEQYSQDLFSLPVGTDGIEPLLQQISTTDPRSRLAAAIKTAIKNKTWLFVPQNISKIEAHKMGLTFSDHDIDQYAFQNDGEIWIDQLKFKELSLKSQTYLIFHEIMMELYVRSKLLTLQETNPTVFEQYKTSFCQKESGHYFVTDDMYYQFCQGDSVNKENKSSFSVLEPSDYPKIRRSTEVLVKANSDSNLTSLYKELFNLGFHKNIIGSLFEDILNSENESPDFSSSLSSFLESKDLQKKCTLNKTKSCSLSFQKNDQAFSVTLSSDEQTFQFSLPIVSKGDYTVLTVKDLVSDEIITSFSPSLRDSTNNLPYAEFVYNKFGGILKIEFRQSLYHLTQWSIVFDTSRPKGFDFSNENQ